MWANNMLFRHDTVIVKVLSSLKKCSWLWFIIILLVTSCARPQNFYTFTHSFKAQWELERGNVFANSDICAEHIQGISGTSPSFAQSFVPHCQKIEAIQLNLHPTKASGWVRVELTTDDTGIPGEVLSRSWLRIEKNSPRFFDHYITFPIGTIRVEPNKTYWITCVEYADRKYIGDTSISTVTNLRFSSTNTYPEGVVLLPVAGRNGLKESWDANFRILSAFTSLPGLRKVSREEKELLPPQFCRDAYWAYAAREWYTFVQENKIKNSDKK
jgi:hypothetical protein